MDRIYLNRAIEPHLLELSTFFPATVIIGPRQVGKTSLVQALRNQLAGRSIYLDLERPTDLAALENFELFTTQNQDAVIILDEVQRRPGLFTELRSIIDRDRRPGRFVLLGSASFDLIRDASETLAGRIAIVELTGLRWSEVTGRIDPVMHWLRGGFPDALLAPNNELSLTWRDNFIRTYLERDLPSYGFRADPFEMYRTLAMMGHLSGQLVNVRSLAKSTKLGEAQVTRYLNLTEQTFIVRRLPAYHGNVGKRLVKTPRLFLRDTGLLHALLTIRDYTDLAKHPIYGASFETYVVEQVYVYALRNRLRMYYYRTTNGAEIDIVLERGGQVVAVLEVKATDQPKLTRGFYSAREALGNPPAFVVCLMDRAPYSFKEGVRVIGIRDLAQALTSV